MPRRWIAWADAFRRVIEAVALRDVTGLDRDFWTDERLEADRRTRALNRIRQPLAREEIKAMADRLLEFGPGADAGTMPVRNTRMVELPGKFWEHQLDVEESDRILARRARDLSVIYFALRPHLLREQFDVFWPEPSTPTQAEVGETPRRRGGRPMVHDWAAAAGFAAGFVVENDYPNAQSALVESIIAWFDKRSPDRRDVERFVRAMYDYRTKRGK